MFKKIIFYNFFGNGDIHCSRSFVRYVVDQLPECTFEYILGERINKNNLVDINKINFIKNTEMRDLLYNKLFLEHDQTLFINTWVGCDNWRYHQHGQGCNLDSYKKMYEVILNKLNLKIPEDETIFLPEIKYQNFKLDLIKNSLEKNKNKIKILICNEIPSSGQSPIFSFLPIINYLKYFDNVVIYFVSKNENIEECSNVIFTDTLTVDKPDLNEISFLSTNCNITIGRNSGVHSFTYVKENILNSNYLNISFTNSRGEANFYPRHKCKNIWSNTPSAQEALELVKKYVI